MASSSRPVGNDLTFCCFTPSSKRCAGRPEHTPPSHRLLLDSLDGGSRRSATAGWRARTRAGGPRRSGPSPHRGCLLRSHPLSQVSTCEKGGTNKQNPDRSYYDGVCNTFCFPSCFFPRKPSPWHNGHFALFFGSYCVLLVLLCCSLFLALFPFGRACPSNTRTTVVLQGRRYRATSPTTTLGHQSTSRPRPNVGFPEDARFRARDSLTTLGVLSPFTPTTSS